MLKQPEKKTVREFADTTVGVLAIQGDFARHTHQIALTGARPLEVRTVAQLEQVDALIIPGGESTTMDILLDRFDLRGPLKAFAESKPIWGTCAGMIMVGAHVNDNQAGIKPLGLIDIDVERNGYGRQVFSFETALAVSLGNGMVTLNASFIRAPKITRVGETVTTIAAYNGDPVLVSSGRIMASSFHTELDDDTTLLEYFLQKFLPIGR